MAGVISAASSPEPELRLEALALIGHLSDPPPSLRPLLAASIKDSDPELRQAAASAWLKLRMPIGDEVKALLADSSDEVRRTAIKLVGLMPKGPAQIEILSRLFEERKKAGNETIGNLADVLETAASAGSAGLNLVNSYLVSNAPLEKGEVEALGKHAKELRRGLLARLEQAQPGSPALRAHQEKTRRAILRVLSRLNNEPGIRSRLIAFATGASEEENRVAASEALLASGSDVGRLMPVLMIAGVNAKAKMWLDEALNEIHPSRYYRGGYYAPGYRPEHGGHGYSGSGYGGHGAGWGGSGYVRPTAYVAGPRLPVFPWPPPAGFKKTIIPSSLLAENTNTLGQVYDQLVQALSRDAGFEWGLFGNVPSGFALIARMERIGSDGKPYPGQARWCTAGEPYLSFRDFLGNLFFEKPGYFRVIAFVVTDDANFGSEELSEASARRVRICDHARRSAVGAIRLKTEPCRAGLHICTQEPRSNNKLG